MPTDPNRPRRSTGPRASSSVAARFGAEGCDTEGCGTEDRDAKDHNAAHQRISTAAKPANARNPMAKSTGNRAFKSLSGTSSVSTQLNMARTRPS